MKRILCAVCALLIILGLPSCGLPQTDGDVVVMSAPKSADEPNNDEIAYLQSEYEAAMARIIEAESEIAVLASEKAELESNIAELKEQQSQLAAQTEAEVAETQPQSVAVLQSEIADDIIARPGIISVGEVAANETLSAPEIAPDVQSVPEIKPIPETEPVIQVKKPAPAPVTEAVKIADSYVLNTSTMKFHLPSCSSAKKIKDENIGHADNRDSVIANGYEPCKNCKP